MDAAKKNVEIAQSEHLRSQNEVEEAGEFLKEAERRWEVVDVDAEEDDSGGKGSSKKRRKVSMSPVGAAAGATAAQAAARFNDRGVWGDLVGDLDANGRRCGQGKMTWENGRIYNGQWKDDMREGQGTYRFDSGNTYQGE